MLSIKIIRSLKGLEEIMTQNELVDFLHEHLGQFGDDKESISKCIDYAFSNNPGKGGYILVGMIENNVVGAVIMNNTGMGGYIPENVLVYIAVNSDYRNKGIGKELLNKAVSTAEGNVKLHVEYDNPAKRLYEREGFKNKYAEMRFEK